MFTCTISDLGLTYKSDKIEDILKRLDEYICENYSKYYTILNNESGASYEKIEYVIKPGDYLILTSRSDSINFTIKEL